MLGKEVQVPSTRPGSCIAFEQVEGLFRKVAKQERRQDQKYESWWIRQELPGVSSCVEWSRGFKSEREEGTLD